MPVHALECLKALADATRLRLFNVLLHHELNVNELVAVMDMGQPRVSRHLQILAAAGLVRSRREGLWVFYAADRARIGAGGGQAEGPNGLGRAPASEDRKRIANVAARTAARSAARESAAGEAGVPEAVLPEIAATPLAVFAEAVAGLLDEEPFGADLARAARVARERNQPVRRFFNAIAHDWERLSGELLGGVDLPALLAERMGSCGVVADLGCGTGEAMAALLGRARRVIGVDGSAEMLARARLRFAQAASAVSLRIGELEHLPLSDGEADCAVMSMVLHHLPDPRAGLAEALRILRPGGRLLVADFLLHGAEDLRRTHGDRWLGFDPDELRSWLETVGFVAHEPERMDLAHGLRLQIVRADRP
jgi:ArsR family transcriptional regulator